MHIFAAASRAVRQPAIAPPPVARPAMAPPPMVQPTMAPRPMAQPEMAPPLVAQPPTTPPVAELSANIPVPPVPPVMTETPPRPVAVVVHLPFQPGTPPMVHRSPTPSEDLSLSPSLTPVNSPTRARPGDLFDLTSSEEGSLADVFEGISQDSVFRDIEPPVYMVNQNARKRLPNLDISSIPHCSYQTKSISVSKSNLEPIVEEDQPSKEQVSDFDSPITSPQPTREGDMMSDYPVSAPSGAEAIHPPDPVRNKGKGKGKAREDLKSKTNVAAANTRLRAKQIREEATCGISTQLRLQGYSLLGM